MKKLILIPSLLLILYSISFSQNILHQKSSEQDDYWNMAFTGGTLFNAVDNVEKDNIFRAGYTAGFDLFCNMLGKKSAIVVTAGYSRIKYTSNNYAGLNPYKEYYELTFGPRFYLGKGYFVETLLGNYIINYAYDMPRSVGLEYYGGRLAEELYTCFGINAGAGTQLELTEDFDGIIKGRINFILPDLKSTIYAGLTAGIVFRNKKIEPETEKLYSKNGTWSFTVSGGINNPELFHSSNYNIGGNAAAELAYRSAPKFEVYGNLEYNEIQRNPDYSRGRSLIDLTFGPRFLFGKEKYLSFCELGMGMYIQDYLNTYYSNGDVPYMGVNFGTGVIINVNKHIGFPFRGKIHLIFNGNSHPGGYLTATGGLRYVL
jgi:hypothetical protein